MKREVIYEVYGGVIEKVIEEYESKIIWKEDKKSVDR
jgi:hypothetical protein